MKIYLSRKKELPSGVFYQKVKLVFKTKTKNNIFNARKLFFLFLHSDKRYLLLKEISGLSLIIRLIKREKKIAVTLQRVRRSN